MVLGQRLRTKKVGENSVKRTIAAKEVFNTNYRVWLPLVGKISVWRPGIYPEPGG
jgi:hypothetical protein